MHSEHCSVRDRTCSRREQSAHGLIQLLGVEMRTPVRRVGFDGKIEGNLELCLGKY